MTREEAIIILENISMFQQPDSNYRKALDIAIKSLEREPKWDRLYKLINDMRYGISPDETVTDTYQRKLRDSQAKLLDVIMYWMCKTESEE